MPGHYELQTLGEPLSKIDGSKGKLYIPVKPNRQEICLKPHWMSFDVPNDALRKPMVAVHEVTKTRVAC